MAENTARVDEPTTVAITVRSDNETRCGICLEKLTLDVNAKQLPCSHVYCLPCLESDEEKVCPACRRSWEEVNVEELRPFCSSAEENSCASRRISCDLCRSTAAVVFCVNCVKVFCEEHETKHDELFDLEHDKVSISTYMSSPARYERMECKEHSSEITVACDHCHSVFCGKCDLNTECQRSWNWKATRISSKTTTPTKYMAGSAGTNYDTPALTKTHHGYRVFEGTLSSDQHDPTSLGLLNSAQCKSRANIVTSRTENIFSNLANCGSSRNHESVFPNCTKERLQTVNGDLKKTIEDCEKGFKHKSYTVKLERAASQTVARKPSPQSRDKRLHQLLKITDFTRQVESKLKSHLGNVSERRTSICRAEKKAWREVDETETRAERLKNQVDEIIRKKIEHLVKMGETFKTEIDKYSMRVVEEAIDFMAIQESKDFQLAKTERRFSEALAKETHMAGLTDLLHSISYKIPQADEFIVEQKSVQFSDWNSKFKLRSFFPTSLEFCCQCSTNEEVIALCAMSNGNIVVGLKPNYLEIRDMHFKVLFKEKFLGQLSDVVAMGNAIVCLWRDGDQSFVYRYSSQLKETKKICSWYTTDVSQERLAVSSNKITIRKCDNSLWNISEDGGDATEIICKAGKGIESLCSTDEGVIVAATSYGIERISNRRRKIVHAWSKLAINDLSDKDTWRSSSLNSVFSQLCSLLNTASYNSGILSKTQDNTKFFYACKAKVILAFSADGAQAYKLTHPELSSVKRVTAIAVCGSHLVVGCGEDGLKLFSIE